MIIRLPRPFRMLICGGILGVVGLTNGMRMGECSTLPTTPSNLIASWYSIESLKTEGTYKYSKGVMANGEIFKDEESTCATRLFPLGQYIKVTNLNNGKSVIVKVTDRVGKRFAKTRVDLSKSAFSKIATLKEGIVKVKVEVINENYTNR